MEIKKTPASSISYHHHHASAVVSHSGTQDTRGQIQPYAEELTWRWGSSASKEQMIKGTAKATNIGYHWVLALTWLLMSFPYWPPLILKETPSTHQEERHTAVSLLVKGLKSLRMLCVTSCTVAFPGNQGSYVVWGLKRCYGPWLIKPLELEPTWGI